MRIYRFVWFICGVNFLQSGLSSGWNNINNCTRNFDIWIHWYSGILYTEIPLQINWQIPELRAIQLAVIRRKLPLCHWASLVAWIMAANNNAVNKGRHASKWSYRKGFFLLQLQQFCLLWQIQVASWSHNNIIYGPPEDIAEQKRGAE